mgnify:CR=1 FL=1
MKPLRKIKKSIGELRKIVDTSKDPIEIRIAYAVENALRWSIEDTVGWEPPEEDVLRETELCREELKRLDGRS